ncbi:MAG: type II secretion system protein GspH, partial [Sphingomonas sp.]
MRRAREAGLTLVEMLVVLAIVGVMASVTLLAAGRGDRASSAESEARRLSVRLRLAADETMVTDRVLALAPDARGYSFVAWDATRRRTGSDSERDIVGEIVAFAQRLHR